VVVGFIGAKRRLQLAIILSHEIHDLACSRPARLGIVLAHFQGIEN